MTTNHEARTGSSTNGARCSPVLLDQVTPIDEASAVQARAGCVAAVIELTGAVQSLIGCFHEDWHTDYGTPDAALQDFVRGEPIQAPALRQDVLELLSQYDTEAALAAYLQSSGFSYRIALGGWATHRDWLLDACDRVDALLEQR